ncbi:peptidase M23-like protein [Mucilaginibacter gracilis]|uniref:Peptidase M23-like protein n=1 Tax=Mucilaginibacter gracilis TaxID=423350 RepID=A0A495IX55_9SPHI|nr:M23 family metallopeptidase [Mucilaginibacter gracilis]RKR80624.1 peptidase M23-like protein [Mucilaginibacter gracilis]
MAAAHDSSRIVSALPLRSLQVTSGFGYRIHPVTGLKQFHNGVDLRAHQDTVFAVMDGMVVQSGYDRLLGFYIKVAHAMHLISIYGHLSVPWVFSGETVTMGQTLGLTGCSGRTTGEHLHFSILYSGRYIDPLQFLSKILITPQSKIQYDTANF